MKRKLIFLLMIWIVLTGTAQNIFQPIQISPENPESLQPGIMEAYEAVLKKVMVPPGLCRLPEPDLT